jgi:FRG domain
MAMKYVIKSTGSIWEAQISTFEQIRDLIENEINVIGNITDFVFRGQSNDEWKLSSTLYRLIEHARRTGAKLTSVEEFTKLHLDRFRLEIRGRRGDNPPRLDDNGLWALGQHFGLATPLLDWSASPYISIFFALGSINENGKPRALWCLHRPRVNKINAKLVDPDKLELLFPDTEDNKRLLGQSGLFSKGPVMKTVDDWAIDNEYHHKEPDPVLLKVSFPGDAFFRKSALKKLHLMNINHSTLFPDLSGASQHCNIVAEDYEV